MNWQNVKVLVASFHGISRKETIKLVFEFVKRNKINHKFHVTKSVHSYVGNV
jgi:hypothetical protein